MGRPKKPPKPDNTTLLENINKHSSISNIFDLFNIPYVSSAESGGHKLYFVSCSICKSERQMLRSVHYCPNDDTYACTQNKCPMMKQYAKGLVGLLEMTTGLTITGIARKIDKHLKEQENEKLAAKKDFQSRNLQNGVYSLNNPDSAFTFV